MFAIVRYFIALTIAASSIPAIGQGTTAFELGNGLSVSLNDDQYQFRMGGMIQPGFRLQQNDADGIDLYAASQRTYFNIAGEAVQEKLSFFLQVDFSSKELMLDGYFTYRPKPWLYLSAGQKQSIANNREMLFMEDHLPFFDRSLVSTLFSRSGREFGVFADFELGSDAFLIVPRLALTSGDGRNSFGVDSRDVDLGGAKVAGRLDVYPLGRFSAGNERQTADLVRESSPKVVIGAAASYNSGASEQLGEGHGLFMMYDIDGNALLPDYRQLYADVLMKYKGWYLLGEYVIATATDLNELYLDAFGADKLLPTEISEYLTLGRGYHVGVGYTMTNGWGIDARYAGATAEFADNPLSLLSGSTQWTGGISKYFKGQAAKIHGAVTGTTPEGGNMRLGGQLMVQIIL